jgi:hypothetical protein
MESSRQIGEYLRYWENVPRPMILNFEMQLITVDCAASSLVIHHDTKIMQLHDPLPLEEDAIDT